MYSQQAQTFGIAVLEPSAGAFSEADGQAFDTDRDPTIFTVDSEFFSVQECGQARVIKQKGYCSAAIGKRGS